MQRKLERDFCFAAGKFSWLHHFDGAVDDLDGLQGNAQVGPSASAPGQVTVSRKSLPGRPSAAPPPRPPLSCYRPAAVGSLALPKLDSALGLDAVVWGTSRKCTDTFSLLSPSIATWLSPNTPSEVYPHLQRCKEPGEEQSPLLPTPTPGPLPQAPGQASVAGPWEPDCSHTCLDGRRYTFLREGTLSLVYHHTEEIHNSGSESLKCSWKKRGKLWGHVDRPWNLHAL